MKKLSILVLFATGIFAQSPALDPFYFSLFDLHPSSNYVLSVDGDNQVVPSTVPFYSVRQGQSFSVDVRQTPIGGFSGTTNLLVNTPVPFTLSTSSISGSGTAALTFYAGAMPPGDQDVWIYENIPRSPAGIWLSMTILPAITPSIYVAASTPPLPLPPYTLSGSHSLPQVRGVADQWPYNLPEAQGTSTLQFPVTATCLAGHPGGRLTFATSGTLDAGLSVAFGPVTVFGDKTATVTLAQAAANLNSLAIQYLTSAITCDAYTAGSAAGALTCDQVTAIGTMKSASSTATVSSTSSTALGVHSLQFAVNLSGQTWTADRATAFTVTL